MHGEDDKCIRNSDGTHEGKKHFGDQGVVENIIFKGILNRIWTRLNWLEQRIEMNFCGHSNNPSSSTTFC
jgi:hypothetical protein